MAKPAHHQFEIDMVDTLTGFYNAVVFELYSEHNMILNKQWSV